MIMNLKPLLLTAAFAAAGLTFGSAQAQSIETRTFDVQITIEDACEINIDPTDIDFGTHGVLSANIDETTEMTVTCTNGAEYDIGLNGGETGTVAARLMTQGGEDVSYQLYTDPGYTDVWGDTIGTDTLNATGTGDVVVHTIYGRVPPQITPTAGVYSDTVTVTLTY